MNAARQVDENKQTNNLHSKLLLLLRTSWHNAFFFLGGAAELQMQIVLVIGQDCNVYTLRLFSHRSPQNLATN